jgi:septal ring factor EnvC (AmiA/AmiB activator)
MKNLQEVFNELTEVKKTIKEIQTEYKDALTNSPDFQETNDKIKELTEKRKQIQNNIQAEMGQRFQDLEIAKDQQKDLKEMISDIAMNNLIDGKSIELKDDNDSVYEPKFSVTFKRTSAKSIEEEK